MMHLILISILCLTSNSSYANQAQPVPIPEDPSTSPQIQIDGTGIGSISFSRTEESKKGQIGLKINDSSLFIGGAQRLYGNGIGSFGIGGVTLESGDIFLHQGFVNFQTENFETLIGRSDSPNAHLIDFPTLRGDDLITLTNPLNPFSDGAIPEEHRYSNVASFTIHQHFNFYENIHVQSQHSEINSYGVTFEYLADPGFENLTLISSGGFGYEYLDVNQNTNSGLHQIYAGGVFNLNQSITNLIDLRFQDILTTGSNLNRFSDLKDTFQADSNTICAAIRYLHQPFGLPGYQLSLTAGYKNYFNVSHSKTMGAALTAVKRLGEGFDLVAQYQGTSRVDKLFEQALEIGFTFNFETTFNRHISPRRSLLNQRHQYIPN